ncbi:MAG TPA: XrtA/PEP-CTERM system histidine kinase PrsK [Stellaceae bacterium]|nr:XrtA/PEP-CTERM system histidine kinase PrsK [Stellaceae bacterium]
MTVVVETLYVGCALAFLMLVALMLLRGRTSRTGIAIVCSCLVSAVWAGASAFPALVPPDVSIALNDLRLSGWLMFAVSLLTLPSPGTSRLLVAAGALCVAALGYDFYVLQLDPYAYGHDPVQQLFRIGLDVAGLLATENLWRNTDAPRRWYVWPICLAIGGLFGYALFLSADTFMTRGQPDAGLALGQPIVAAFSTPLLALAMARNREWRVDIHVSRQVVLHTATLVASGGFLLAVAFVGLFLREIGGVWGLPLQLAMLIGSLFVLGVVLASDSIRRKVKFIISRNFFSNRYDYRVEWLKFIELISDPKRGDELQARIIRALAEFVESPGGVLWSLTPGTGYYPTAAWKRALPARERLAADDAFLAGFQGGGWIQQRVPTATVEPWPFAAATTWLAVPLPRGSDIIGFVFLDRPGHGVALDWEAFDLLRAAGRQAASYLAEERSTKALIDAELLNNYNKRFAFVVHDIKNLASQLGLVVTNARQHIEDPEFRQDMLQTVEDAVARMNHLLNQLKANPAPRPPPSVDPDGVIADVLARLSRGSCRVEAHLDLTGCEVAIDAERLRSALTHLVQNAIDASPTGAPVTVRSQRRGEELVIEVVDRGDGMDPHFVRDELFMPFRSTKSGGYGIGAFQTRELIRMAGGELDVISKKGAGTTMRVTLPLAAGEESRPPSAAV